MVTIKKKIPPLCSFYKQQHMCQFLWSQHLYFWIFWGGADSAPRSWGAPQDPGPYKVNHLEWLKIQHLEKKHHIKHHTTSHINEKNITHYSVSTGLKGLTKFQRFYLCTPVVINGALGTFEAPENLEGSLVNTEKNPLPKRATLTEPVVLVTHQPFYWVLWIFLNLTIDCRK